MHKAWPSTGLLSRFCKLTPPAVMLNTGGNSLTQTSHKVDERNT